MRVGRETLEIGHKDNLNLRKGDQWVGVQENRVFANVAELGRIMTGRQVVCGVRPRSRSLDVNFGPGRPDGVRHVMQRFLVHALFDGDVEIRMRREVTALAQVKTP